jgi:hypothetical protein
MHDRVHTGPHTAGVFALRCCVRNSSLFSLLCCVLCPSSCCDVCLYSAARKKLQLVCCLNFAIVVFRTSSCPLFSQFRASYSQSQIVEGQRRRRWQDLT